MALGVIWVMLTLILVGWQAGSRPASGGLRGVASAESLVLGDAPRGAMVSLWVWLDESGRTGAWVILEAAERWPAPIERYWRRRILPGWNHLIWDDLSGLADRGPVRLRLAAETPRRWSITDVRVVSRHGLAHLTTIRGLVAALFMGVALILLALVHWLAHPKLPRPTPWMLGVLGIAAVSLGLRLHTLGSHSFWFDEVLTAIGAQSLTWVLYTPQIFGHPPVQYLTTWAVSALGAGEGWLRGPFALAGTASVVVLAVLGRRLLGAPTGIVAAALLGLAPFHVELSQLARPYAFLFLFSLTSFLALIRALERPGIRDWLWFSALATLNLYTHYLGLQVLVIQAVAAAGWLARRRGRGWPAAAVSFGGVTVLFAPWFPVLGRAIGDQAGHGDLSVATLLDLSVRVFIPQFLGPGLAGTCALILAAVGLGSLLSRRPELLVVFVVWIVGPLAVLWLGQSHHFVAGRHMAFVMPPLMLLVAHGLISLVEQVSRWTPRHLPRLSPLVMPAGVGCAVAVLVGNAAMQEARAGYYQRRHGADWRTVAAVLDHVVAPNDRVLATLGSSYPLQYYWRQDIDGLDPAALPEHPGRLAPGRRAWIISLSGWDESPELGQWLATHAVKVGEVPASWSISTVRIHRARARQDRPRPNGSEP
jgi:mannosyltransferase